LDELATALGDDSNFASTITNTISEKAPIASPSFTGTATFNGIATINQNANIGGCIKQGDSAITNVPSHSGFENVEVDNNITIGGRLITPGIQQKIALITTNAGDVNTYTLDYSLGTIFKLSGASATPIQNFKINLINLPSITDETSIYNITILNPTGPEYIPNQITTSTNDTISSTSITHKYCQTNLPTSYFFTIIKISLIYTTELIGIIDVTYT